MTIRLSLFCILLCALSACAQDTEFNQLFQDLVRSDTLSGKAVIAILPFKASGQGITEDAGRVVAEFGVAFLRSTGRYHVVERAELSKAVEELKLSQSGLMDESSGLKVGQMLSANRLLTGTISDIFGRRMITARMVRTETGDIIAGSTVTLPAAALDQFTRELLGERMQVTAVLFRSAVVPGWGQLFTGHPVRGGACLALFAGALTYTLYNAARTNDAKGVKDDYLVFLNSASREGEMNARHNAGENWDALVREYNDKLYGLYDDYTAQYDKTVLWGAITGCIWALNLVDASFVGRESQKKYELYFSASPAASVNARLAYHF
ncbi:MAG: CsgG/HfaB family protein [Fibrobacterota bacterium]